MNLSRKIKQTVTAPRYQRKRRVAMELFQLTLLSGER
jgi:hypothetical protein